MKISFTVIRLVLLIGMLGMPASLQAQTTTRCTNTTPLDGSGYTSSTKSPRPNFKLPSGVTVKKCLTVNKKTGEAKQTCEFKNGSGGAVSFIFCNMVEISSGGGTTTINNDCNIGYNATTKTWFCDTSSPSTVTDPPGMHFGCEVVTMAAGGSHSSSSSGTNSSFVGKEAKDFEVNYADIFDLEIDGGATYDAASCATCFGANKSTNFGAVGGGHAPRDTATGFWIMTDIPITDPYVQWVELDGTTHAKEYQDISEELSVPSEFPVECPELGRTLPGVIPPLSYDQDLLLWDIFTMTDSPGTFTSVNIDVYSSPTFPGVDVQASLSATSIEGGSTDYGSVTVIRPAGTVPEGEEIPFSIAVVDPADPTNVQYWEQDGRAIQDTEPPQVLSHQVSFLNGRLSASLQVHDSTSTPVAANLFYSIDGGFELVPASP